VVRLAERGAAPAGWDELARAVQSAYPDLRATIVNGKPTIRGTFPIVHEGEELDRFAIQIDFPEGIANLPSIREIGGRIPRTAERHVFTGGAICTEVPELTLLRGEYSLLRYLDGPVRNYFLGQSLVERGEQWPFGQRDHNKPGLLEAYGEILGVSGEPTIRRYLVTLGQKKIKRHWACPCGSGAPIRECHDADLRRLHAAVPARIARQALDRLDRFS
jgi:hypothetical protein